jgi:hypothetical protein
VEWQVDDLAEDVEDAVLLLKTLLKLDVLVPKGVGQEVLTTALRAAFEQPRDSMSVTGVMRVGMGAGVKKVMANMLQKKSEFARVAIWTARADGKCVDKDRLEQRTKRGVVVC